MPADPASLRPDPLSVALDAAIAGKRAPLFDLLQRGSRLPGPTINTPLADAFVQACRARGAKADKLLLDMAHLTADEAPGANALEFLPVCGVLALATRAATDPSVRTAFVNELHTSADDLRFRVREAVVEGLSRVGGAAGDALVHGVSSWTDGYFHAAAVVTAIGRPVWLTVLHDTEAVLARFDEAFDLLREAPRAAARYPGHKALMDAMGDAPARIAMRFGVPVFDMLVRWAAVKDPALRDLVEGLLADKKLPGRFRPELERVRQTLKTTEPPARNPDHDHGPSRDRSGGRKRGRAR